MKAATSGLGPERTSREVRLESAIRTRAALTTRDYYFDLLGRRTRWCDQKLESKLLPICCLTSDARASARLNNCYFI
jgi:hypothetical protein